MLTSNIKYVLVFLLSVLVYVVQSVEYSDLETMGVACRDKADSCTGSRRNAPYTERSCECDTACTTYNDCCIDSSRRRPNRRNSLRNRIACMPYGDPNAHTGVYMVVNCSSTWQGSSEIREKCEGPMDMSDPLKTIPVVSIAQAMTYRNRYCAECNYASMPNLKSFQVKVGCQGLIQLTSEEIAAEIKYNSKLNGWGVDRPNIHGNGTVFNYCDIVFDVPSYVNRSVRFCRANVTSSCPPDWNRPLVKKACEEYMAVVYEIDALAYRNVHCAICNNRTVDDVACRSDLSGRRKPGMSFGLLLDFHEGSSGDEVGVTRHQCPPTHTYDPFFKNCRELVCALPNHVVVDGTCVRASG